MAINKIYPSFSQAVADIPDGASLMVAGFGMAGYPQELVLALRDRGAKELTIICNSCGGTREDRLDVGILIKAKRVRKAIASIGVLPGNSAPAVEEQWPAESWRSSYRSKEPWRSESELAEQGSAAFENTWADAPDDAAISDAAFLVGAVGGGETAAAGW